MGKFATALKKRQTEQGPLPAPVTPAHSEAGAAAPPPSPEPTGRAARVAPPCAHLLISHGAEPAVTEQYRRLRTSLLHYHDGRPPRTVLVTSTLRGEGKSTVAANLAISIAQSVKEHVLLIDCDLRQPTLPRLFGLRPAAGLADHLRRGVELSELILSTGLPKLTLLPAGPSAEDAAELLSSDRMRSLLAEVARRYEDRFIILDSAPLIPTTDPAILAPQVDAVLLVVRSGVAGRELIAQVIDTVCGEKLLGVVFNAIGPQSAGQSCEYYKSAYGT